MRLTLKNILKIKSADVQLGGLTVITGENNSGKSTVGKILFSIVKAWRNKEFLSKIDPTSNIADTLGEIRAFFRAESINLDSLNDIPSLSAQLVSDYKLWKSVRPSLEKEVDEAGFSPRIKSKIEEKILLISILLLQSGSPGKVFGVEFYDLCKSEFRESIISFGESQAEVDFYDDTIDADTCHLHFATKINADHKPSPTVHLKGALTLSDATFVESPVYLHILDTIRGNNMSSPSAALRILSRAKFNTDIPFHLADMAEKLTRPYDPMPDLFSEIDKFDELIDSIKSSIGGYFQINPESRQLTFMQGSNPVPPLSVASGIKSFGLLQRLLEGNCLSTDRILIWDEPEIHLHPEWQIVLSNILVKLVTLGVPVIISTHSPYFLQAIRFHASAYGVESSTHYYHAEPDEETGLSEIHEVIDDLNQVFTRLAKPLRKIMNVDAARNTLK
ncbi:MAG: AAA family ATPase [Muribaculaceae bacterium]|nr:AAA family ATPase [Muribaculaceae bacterium]